MKLSTAFARPCRQLLTVAVLWQLLMLQPSYGRGGGARRRRLVAEFVHNGAFNLSHMVLALDGSGQVYVAGTNSLYQLDDRLRVKHRVKTGETLVT